jgi:hypothetical protein
MPLDPVLAQGVQLPQFKIPDYSADMAQMAQMRNLQLQERGLQNQEQMNSLKLQQFQKEQADLDALQKKIAASGGPTNLKAASEAMLASGIPHFMDTGLKIQEKLQNQANFQALLNPAAQEPAQPNALAVSVGGVAPPAAPTTNSLAARRDAAYSLGTPAAIALGNALNDELKESRKTIPLTAGSTLFDPQGKKIATAPEKTPAPPAPPSLVAEYNFAKTPEGGDFKGSYQQFVTERSAAMRPPPAPRAERAPSPLEKAIDNNTGKETFVTREEVIANPSRYAPISSKSKSEEKSDAGKEELVSELDNVRAAFGNLDRMRAISSTGRSALSNLAAGTAASGVGQAIGRLAGTPEQTERDVIAGGRLRLVNAIKNATGMSSQQLNSNVELQTMLKSISDPSQSIETVNRNLDQIEKLYVKGKPVAGMKPAAQPAAPTGGADNKAVIDGLLKKYGG